MAKKKDYIYNPKEFRRNKTNNGYAETQANKKHEKLTVGVVVRNAAKIIAVLILFKYGFHAF
ncbi:hypothetical protein [uncultured Tolumonas sp.]|uniref:hypothetical protein n=1 Tax=uncultured Tolumonas sp. TaxID=263765 RepID=UPI002A0A1D50|nr:hypothetical protein [uncultured Tolumonas sp.]